MKSFLDLSRLNIVVASCGGRKKNFVSRYRINNAPSTEFLCREFSIDPDPLSFSLRIHIRLYSPVCQVQLPRIYSLYTFIFIRYPVTGDFQSQKCMHTCVCLMTFQCGAKPVKRLLNTSESKARI